MRTRPAISRVDSIRHTASIAPLAAAPGVLCSLTTSIRAPRTVGGQPAPGHRSGRHVHRVDEQLPHLAAALPARPVVQVNLQQTPGQFDRLVLGAHLDHRIPADQFLGLGERAVVGGDRTVRQRHDRALLARSQPALLDQGPVDRALRREPTHRFEQLRGRRPEGHGLVGLDERHETHGVPPSWCGRPGWRPTQTRRPARAVLDIGQQDSFRILRGQILADGCRERRRPVDVFVTASTAYRKDSPMTTRPTTTTPSTATPSSTTTGAVPSTSSTRLLLGAGVVAGPIFVLTAGIQALTREGFTLSHQPVSYTHLTLP